VLQRTQLPKAAGRFPRSPSFEELVLPVAIQSSSMGSGVSESEYGIIRQDKQ
jgi:hypothetical protein